MWRGMRQALVRWETRASPAPPTESSYLATKVGYGFMAGLLFFTYFVMFYGLYGLRHLPLK